MAAVPWIAAAAVSAGSQIPGRAHFIYKAESEGRAKQDGRGDLEAAEREQQLAQRHLAEMFA